MIVVINLGGGSISTKSPFRTELYKDIFVFPITDTIPLCVLSEVHRMLSLVLKLKEQFAMIPKTSNSRVKVLIFIR